MSQYRLMRHLVAVAALGAFATVGCFVVDDTDDDDEGGGGEAGEASGGSGGSATGGKGGSATGGKGGSATGGKGGSATGGTSTGGKGGTSTGGAGPAGGTAGTGPVDGMAVMKYCNELFRTNSETGMQEAAELTLTFNGVEATALSGTCTPVVPAACIPIDAVTGPDVSLTDPSDGTLVVDGSIPTLVVADGEEILVFGTVDDTTGAPTVLAGQFAETYVCADTDPFTPLEARSTPFRLSTERSLRVHGNPAASRWMKRAVIAPGIGR